MTAALERGEWSAARPGRTLPPGKTRYPFYRRLGGLQGRSGRSENLVATGIRSRIVQRVVSRYTDWATRPTIGSGLPWIQEEIQYYTGFPNPTTSPGIRYTSDVLPTRRPVTCMLGKLWWFHVTGCSFVTSLGSVWWEQVLLSFLRVCLPGLLTYLVGILNVYPEHAILSTG